MSVTEARGCRGRPEIGGHPLCHLLCLMLQDICQSHNVTSNAGT